MTAATAPVLVDRIDRTVVVTLNRPEARNAVDTAVARSVGAALADADADPDVWCVVLTGAGDRSFCAGADLKALGRGELPIDPEHPERGFAGYVSHAVSVPTIAAVNGTALGGGTELALASDLVVAAEGATFGLPEVSRGIIAAAGGALRLPEQMPRKVAMRMVLTGQPISAEEAARWGLVNEVVPAAELRDAALALAAQICANAPLAVQASKRLAVGIVDGGVPAEAEAWGRNQSEVEAVAGTADAMEGITAFVEKRVPVWQGR
ncbi:enoyl-CoA hydratase-related protein [Euzebya sp.]|uniref:enoyl-CoA hydratase-related protein n=1 Tax=Euzebya sp. TaxID=1971409 RepID=UPI0035166A03